jgi:hypothetical protein
MIAFVRTYGPALLLLAATACSSHATPANSVSGMLGDAGLVVASDWANVDTVDAIPTGFSNDGPDGSPVIPPASTGKVQTITVVLSNNVSFTCTAEKNEALSSFANVEALRLQVSAAKTVTPSTYTVGASATPTASVVYQTTSATCGEGRSAVATSGTVTVSAVGDAGVSGSFSVTFGESDYLMQPALGTLTGTFDAPLCPASNASDAGVPEAPDGGVVCHS